MKTRMLDSVTGLAVCLLFGARLAGAADNQEWRLVGFTSEGPKDTATFYLDDIMRTDSGTLKVWTKSLDGAKMRRASRSTKPSDPSVRRIAAKHVMGYRPPYSKVKQLSDDEMLDVLSYEEIADSGRVKPSIRIQLEFDCAQSQYRIVSAITDKGQTSPFFAMQPVPPESTMSVLKMMVCTAGQ